MPLPMPLPQTEAVEEKIFPAAVIAAELPIAPIVIVAPAVTIEPVEPIVVPVPPPPPPVDLSANLQQAGLQMVETSSATLAAAPPASSAPQQLGRKPKPAAIISDEPMQMVETQNK
jgi:ribonuclease E